MDLPIKVETVTNKGRTFHVIQEAQVTGGSKSRAIYAFMQARDEYNEFVYAGPATGYAQYALAYCAKLLDKKATVFLSSCPRVGNTIPTQGAIDNGATIIRSIQLKDAQEAAREYCSGDTSRFLCPFGMDDTEFHQIFVDKLRAAGMPDIAGNVTIWVTVGSGTLLRVLLEIYPNNKFGCVVVGKNIWEDQFKPEDWARMTIYKSDLFFTQNVKKRNAPPYNSVPNYDAKVWEFVRRFGKSGDYIYNVAGIN